MRSTQRLLGIGAALSFAATAASAQGRFWNVCGGNEFNTCASVALFVSGSSVTVRVWNLSGFYGSYANTVFTGVGFDNIGGVSAVSGSLAMSGPVRASNTPGAWALGNDQQVGGGIKLDVVPTTSTGVNNAIASACADPGSLPGGSNQLYMNPCALPSGGTDPGYITLTFNVTGTWDVANTVLLIKGQNGPNGASTECVTGGDQMNCVPTAVPEPLSIALIGTGLAGMGGAGLLRRRRKNGDVGTAG